jgi:hypothetical protein
LSRTVPDRNSPSPALEVADASTTDTPRDAWAVAAVVAAGNLGILAGLGVHTGPVVAALLIFGAVAGAITRIAPHKRSTRILVGVVLGVALPTAVGMFLREDPLDESQITRYLPRCVQDPCSVVEHITTGTGTGEVHVFGVQRTGKVVQVSRDPKDRESAVLVVTPEGRLRWKSTWAPGFGLLAMDTDVTSHIFVRFAINNDFAAAWVLSVKPDGVEDFGTIGGTRLAVDGYSIPNDRGLRYLYAYRRRWHPGDGQPVPLRDIYFWNGRTYRFGGCEPTPEENPLDWPAEKRFAAGSRQCPRPVSPNAFNIP